jgi:outer membrane protein assembly factor BamA
MGLQNYIGEWSNEQKKRLFTKYIVSEVHFHMDYDPAFVPENATVVSSQKDKYYFTWINQTLLRERTLIKNCLIRPGEVFNERLVELTYERFNRLGIVKYVDISFDPVSDNELECHIVLSRSKLNSISANIEGTYSAGDWGIAAGLGYINKNIFKGAEELSLNAGVGYEWRANGGRAIEAKAEAGLKFPNQLNVNLMYNYQTRPNEFTRTIANADLSYRIARRRSKWTHDFRFVDISYVYLPWISKEFSETFLKPTNILKYSYEDHLIAAFSYGCTYSSFREKQPLRSFSTLNMQVELAGNLLYALSLIAKLPQNADGAYTIGKIPFSQYVKADVSYVYNQIFNEKHRLVYHAALGVAIPFGNAQTIPFEKRYFSGGPNSVRGWSVRSLGPGSYSGKDGNMNYINHTGDIKLDMNIEYRTHLFWKFNGAAFIDAGNIWNIRDYKGQEEGTFRLNRFYKQLAMAYGLGIRFDLDYLIIRFDGGMKAINPMFTGKDKYPFLRPNFNRDFTFHFAVGYPF